MRMASLRRDPKSGSWLSRKEVPKALRAAYTSIYHKSFEEIFRQPADLPAARARVLFSDWQAEIDARFAALIMRAKQQGAGHDLTQRQAHALAGEWFRWFTSQHDESPGHPQTWRALYRSWDAAVFHSDALDDEGRMVELEGREAIYEQLAKAARAPEFLIAKGETLSPSATAIFLGRLLWTFPKAVELLERRAKGDYSPDPHLETLPEYRPTSPKPSAPSKPKGPSEIKSATALFDRYATTANLAPETVLRRRGVVTELDALLAGRALDTLEPDEAQGWLTAMVDSEKRSASTVRRVYIVALNALGRWAEPGSTRSTTTEPLTGPNTPGVASTIPEKAVGSQTAPMLLPPCPAYDPRWAVPLKGLVNGCRSCSMTLLPPKLFM
jgi:hypothetical protein